MNPGFILSITGRHTIADVNIADKVDWNITNFAITKAQIRYSTDTPFAVAGIGIKQHIRRQFVFRIKIFPQAFIHQAFGHFITIHVKPAFVGIMHKFTIAVMFAQIEVGKEIIAAESFEIFTQRTGKTGFFAAAFAIGKHQRTGFISDMD